VIEKREHIRRPINMPVTFTVKGSDRSVAGIGKDISIGGIHIESAETASFGASVTVRVNLRTAAGTMGDFDLPGVVRWTRGNDMGIQFGMLGVHETHAITELTKQT
jgi:hypothetical protein